MKSSTKTPASVRYFKARLKPFGRPMFWGSLGIISILGFVGYQYWQNPDWLRATGENTENPRQANGNLTGSDNSQLSSEELAIGADLENVDLLLQELKQNETIPLATSTKPQKSPTVQANQDTIFNRFKEQQKNKLNRPSSTLIPTANSTNNYVLPNNTFGIKSTFNSVSPLSNINKNNQSNNLSQPPIISNPVGNLYLSNRNQTLNANPNQEQNVTNSFAPRIVNSNNQSGNLLSDRIPSNSLPATNNLPTNNLSNYASPQITQPQPQNQTEPTNTINNRLTPTVLTDNTIDYQLPSASTNYGELAPNNSQSQSNNSITNNNVNQNNSNTADNSPIRAIGSLQPSSLNQPDF